MAGASTASSSHRFQVIESFFGIQIKGAGKSPVLSFCSSPPSCELAGYERLRSTYPYLNITNGINVNSVPAIVKIRPGYWDPTFWKNWVGREEQHPRACFASSLSLR
jgi:hypothetical protein